MPKLVKNEYGRPLGWNINTAEDTTPGWSNREEDAVSTLCKMAGKKGLIKNVDYSDHGSFSNMLTDLGDNSTTAVHHTVTVLDTVNISTNTTVNNNIAIKIAKNGTFNVASGVTLTINGELLIESKKMVFTGSGTVVINSINYNSSNQLFQETLTVNLPYTNVIASWFGARNGSTVVRACTAAQNGGKVTLVGGTHTFDVPGLNLLNVPIEPLPGCHIVINSGCAPINMRIGGTPFHKIIDCALADVPAIKIPQLNVENFGAVGGSTDDTIAYQMTMKCASISKIGKVYTSLDDSKISETVTINNCFLIGTRLGSYGQDMCKITQVGPITVFNLLRGGGVSHVIAYGDTSNNNHFNQNSRFISIGDGDNLNNQVYIHHIHNYEGFYDFIYSLYELDCTVIERVTSWRYVGHSVIWLKSQTPAPAPSAALTIRNCNFDQEIIVMPADREYIGIYVYNTDAASIQNCIINGFDKEIEYAECRSFTIDGLHCEDQRDIVINTSRWSAGASVTAGQLIKPTSSAATGCIYKCTTPGTTGGAEPDWGRDCEIGTTVNDNGVVWTVTAMSIAVFQGNYGKNTTIRRLQLHQSQICGIRINSVGIVEVDNSANWSVIDLFLGNFSFNVNITINNCSISGNLKLDVTANKTNKWLVSNTGISNNTILPLLNSDSFGTSISSVGGASISCCKLTPEGGFAVLLKNKTGAPTVKGYSVTQSIDYDKSVQYIEVDKPSFLGVFYEDDIADGEYTWVVTGGLAEVYCNGSVSRGEMLCGFLTGDTGYTPGVARKIAYPSAPISTDRQFYKLATSVASHTGAGLVLSKLT